MIIAAAGGSDVGRCGGNLLTATGEILITSVSRRRSDWGGGVFFGRDGRRVTLAPAGEAASPAFHFFRNSKLQIPNIKQIPSTHIVVICDLKFGIYSLGVAMAKSKQALRQTLLHALKVFAGKEADRDAIEPSDTPVNIEIRATVGRGAAANVTETIVGNLIVDADGETHNNVAAEQAEIVGYFLARLSDGARKAVLEEMPAAFLAAGGTLGVADKYVQAAEALLKALRFRSGSKVQRGKVTLNLIEHAADAGKAVKPRRRAA